ncbi:Uncharacterised protein [Mycobacterium tuberculosis]|nr:Uncharacterised protein [Mycobacterium tuberculosis]COY10053.1 Uncharacterised protein [Mycobacterium tuberculosis]COZ40333.1 Uncharacterised protein [Mycobacterium tuberculosis]
MTLDGLSEVSPDLIHAFSISVRSVLLNIMIY